MTLFFFTWDEEHQEGHGCPKEAGNIHPPDEPNHPTRATWKRKKVRVYKYVDDGFTTEKGKFENAEVGESREEVLDADGTVREAVRTIKLKHAIPS